MSAIIMKDSHTMKWEDPPKGSYLTDVKEKMLWQDEQTGACFVLFQWPVGTLDELHIHPNANQYIFGLDGEIEGPDGQLTPIDGMFLMIPKGTVHGRTNITKESLVLFYWDGSRAQEQV
jgi:oxalate decarboxylase/phosphoglucose isomerase-like protein (cupin superfamily)